MFGYSKSIVAIGMSIFIIALPFTVMASTDKIETVNIDIASDIKVGSGDSDVKVTTSSDKYHVDNVYVTNEPSGDWKDGDQPFLQVNLVAVGNNSFSSTLSTSDVSMGGTEGVISAIGRMSESRITVFIVLEVLEDDVSNYDLNVSGLEWDELHGSTRWDTIGDASKYQVRLYRGSSPLTEVITTTDPSYDFSGSITKSGNYHYKVRAISDKSFKGKWSKSETWHVSEKELKIINSGSSKGKWLMDDKGWWYCNEDGSYTANNWQYINNNWYYFGQNGYMVTGWINWGSKWYFCDKNGAMLTSTITPDGYYVGSDGIRSEK
ncbi:N-acetylmuramoyl-L-alanine amidase family protein [Lacrimispora sp.]|uniref:N-acetylmuramoyl-L-alanine amidase family protein n=1 Tax=Lacrimispora sp. TaxID=2719234 RepID=UPI0028A07490|nr:hypothetical protein [Lacrimispora sp.]